MPVAPLSPVFGSPAFGTSPSIVTTSSGVGLLIFPAGVWPSGTATRFVETTGERPLLPPPLPPPELLCATLLFTNAAEAVSSVRMMPVFPVEVVVYLSEE